MGRKKVTYTLELDGKFIIIEGVPARVSVETGERFFAPKTVEILQQIVARRQKPVRVVKTSVFAFSTSLAVTPDPKGFVNL